ncbi:MAG TPA: zf-HC2 domain-containing protein [Gemmatimonadaceae bacterium]|nr:zf-HC2 domain-containing protein [Gemmatimonadaceae bacterium]
MQHLDEGTIHAWLDGELPDAERAAAEAHMAQCPECAAAVADARGFIAASSRILTALDAVPGGVVPAPAKESPRRFVVSRAWMAAAAVLVLGIGTVIATRPARDVAVLRVAETRPESTPIKVAPTTVPPAEPAPAPAEKPLRRATKRIDKDQLRNAPMVAQAPAPKAAPAAAPATMADSAPPRALRLGQVVVTGVGVASAMEADSAAPQVVSRSFTVEGADTIVTTIYTVKGVRVSLIEHPSPLERQRAARSFSDAVMAKASESAPTENSITWSDSTGRTRTLRGAMSQAELERLKARLFGATP